MSPDWHVHVTLNLGNFKYLFTDEVYGLSYFYSIKTAFFSTLICLALGYPMAYAIARTSKSTQSVLLLIIILPFWTSFLLRVYALEGIIRETGLLNTALLWLGVIHHPLQIMRTTFAVYLGIIYSYLPFMVLPLFATLEKLDHSLLEAAADLGSPPWRAFLDVTLPLSMPGIIAGSMLVFIPAIGEFVIPTLLGGPDNLMIGRVLWDEFFGNRDWPVASAVAIAFLVLLVGPIALYQHYSAEQQEALSRWKGARLAIPDHDAVPRASRFLYMPMLVLIAYSFNASALVSVWGGFSTSWYTRLVHNDQILDAAWLSLEVGAGRVDRGGDARHAGRDIAGALQDVPRPAAAHRHGQRAAGHARDHHRHHAAAAVRVDAASVRLAAPRLHHHRDRAHRILHRLCDGHRAIAPASADRSLEEAAMDLGAGPVRAFIDTTLPIIAPALASSWLLSFTLSLDDLVISSFVSGPGASTLPMVIFSKVKLGVSPDINALASLIIASSARAC